MISSLQPCCTSSEMSFWFSSTFYESQFLPCPMYNLLLIKFYQQQFLFLLCQSKPLLGNNARSSAKVSERQRRQSCSQLNARWLNKFRSNCARSNLYRTLLYPCNAEGGGGGELGLEMSSYSPLNGTLDSTFAVNSFSS